MYLYIMGRAHCGSTILDIILSGGVAIEGLGELVSGLERYATRQERCSCGAQMHECRFWTEVRRRFEAEGHDWAEFAQASRRQTDIRAWLETWLADPDDPKRLRLAIMTQALARAVAGASGKPNLVDSNKETTRALFLLKYVPQARVIHLVRDPRAIQQSHHWRIRAGRGFHFMRRKHGLGRTSQPLLLLLGAVSWVIGSTLGELVHMVAPERVLRLRYEDLRDSPADAVRAVEAAFGVPVGDIVARLERGDPFPVGHIVGGNDIRRQREVRFDSGVELTRPPLPRWVRCATTVLCWPLMLRYGYLRRRSALA